MHILITYYIYMYLYLLINYYTAYPLCDLHFIRDTSSKLLEYI